jgi:hypothetical protein
MDRLAGGERRHGNAHWIRHGGESTAAGDQMGMGGSAVYRLGRNARGMRHRAMEDYTVQLIKLETP